MFYVMLRDGQWVHLLEILYHLAPNDLIGSIANLLSLRNFFSFFCIYVE